MNKDWESIGSPKEVRITRLPIPCEVGKYAGQAKTKSCPFGILCPLPENHTSEIADLSHNRLTFAKQTLLLISLPLDVRGHCF